MVSFLKTCNRHFHLYFRIPEAIHNKCDVQLLLFVLQCHLEEHLLLTSPFFSAIVSRLVLNVVTLNIKKTQGAWKPLNVLQCHYYWKTRIKVLERFFVKLTDLKLHRISINLIHQRNAIEWIFSYQNLKLSKASCSVFTGCRGNYTQ